MYKRLIPIILFSLLLTACGKTPNSTLPTADLVGTQVSLVLTSTAAAIPTQAPVLPTSTQQIVIETATSTYEPTPTPTLTLSPTPVDDPKASLGAPTWTTNLDSVSSWYTEDNDYSNIRGDNGTLLLTSKQAVGYHSWSMHYHQLTNFYLEATLKTGTCTGNDLYGLIFRAPDTSKGYFYSITCDGKVGLRAFDGSEFTKVADFSPSATILTGSNQVNHLGVLANGSTLSLYVNSRKVMDVSDSTFTSGTFGVFISAVNTPGFQIALDDLSYWTLP
jgi:hypothetical protein